MQCNMGGLLCRMIGMTKDINIWTIVKHSLFHLFMCWNVVSMGYKWISTNVSMTHGKF